MKKIDNTKVVIGLSLAFLILVALARLWEALSK